eukprot:TRINITY_DN25971_c0_g1_i2.p1 TRINITY_DN25971_c0_g1~~TRINITY_DN25971_c0_g1_i2.p1  ORF type:complete len:331 (+),score=70.67 TRINITY_DN25971_c0_g1_i2:132-1124(+)
MEKSHSADGNAEEEKINGKTQPDFYYTSEVLKKRISLSSFQPIEYEIGSGRFSVVHRVIRLRYNTSYAIKFTYKSTIESQGYLKQPFVEREALLAVSHKNIVKMFHSFSDKDVYYFVLEYVPNGDLKAFYEKKNSDPKHDMKRRHMLEIIDALEHLYKLQIVHRDLTPENILLDANYSVKVIDFGAARFIDDASLVKTGGIKQTYVGKPYYQSPEIVKGEKVSMGSDLWALGCLLFAMFVGKSPFYDEDINKSDERVTKGEFECPKEIPEDAVDLIKQLLVMDPNKRLGYCGDGNEKGFEKLKNHRFLRKPEASPKKEEAPMEAQSGVNA